LPAAEASGTHLHGLRDDVLLLADAFVLGARLLLQRAEQDLLLLLPLRRLRQLATPLGQLLLLIQAKSRQTHRFY
jgi:hypothetical protein